MIFLLQFIRWKKKTTSFLNWKKVAYSLTEFITILLDQKIEDFSKVLRKNIKRDSKYTYSSINILNNKVPLIILLGFYHGFSKILERYNVEYTITDSRKTVDEDQLANVSALKFNDGYIYYKK